MSRIFNPRLAFRTFAVGIGPAACMGSLVMNRRAIRCDSGAFIANPPARQSRRPFIDVTPDTVRQVSSGSIVGFGAGLLVALFSKTIAMLGGLVAFSMHVSSSPPPSYPASGIDISQVALRYGWNVPRMLGINKLLDRSKFWKKTQNEPWFTASFAATFIMAAFVHL
ncbi:hypothetical protein G7046_g2237 [Stylonectria norvegica]|nr:hypothetical protein G7046_g2237 [Stylonectria norvegica]